MPTPSNPSPRRNASSAAPRSKARAASPKTVDLSPPKPADAGTKRRALKKKRARQGNMVAWSLAGAVTVAIAGMALGVRAAGVKTKGIWTEYQSVQGRLTQKRATLADLRAQLESGQRRLHALSSASGKERVLVENGFIKPGERLLLFPKNAAK